MGVEQEILTALQERVASDVTKLKAEEILFHAYLPVASHIAKKNGRPIKWSFKKKRRYLGKSDRLITTENTLVYQLRSKATRVRLFEPIGHDLWIMFLWYFKDYYVKQRTKAEKLLPPRRRENLPDQSNLYEIYQDALQKARVITNDTNICSHDRSRRLPGKENAVEIFIMRFDDGTNYKSNT